MSAVRERHEMTLLLVSGLSGFFSVLGLVLLFVFIPKAFLRVSVVDSALGLWLANRQIRPEAPCSAASSASFRHPAEQKYDPGRMSEEIIQGWQTARSQLSQLRQGRSSPQIVQPFPEFSGLTAGSHSCTGGLTARAGSASSFAGASASATPIIMQQY
jgi:hypothetical protein